MSELKNCLSCRNGVWESDGEFGEYTHFTCEKREDDGYNNLDTNLNKESYRKRYKRCFEPMIEVTCITCKEVEEVIFKPKDNYQCFECYLEENRLEK